jgi:hypothetical protein
MPSVMALLRLAREIGVPMARLFEGWTSSAQQPRAHYLSSAEGNMPVKIDDVETLKRYLNGVMVRAEHHAQNVSGVALALVGAIIWRKDSSEIRVRGTTDKDMKNVLQVDIGGEEYSFKYDHEDGGSIELHRGKTGGPLVHRFSNATPLAEVQHVFRDL